MKRNDWVIDEATFLECVDLVQGISNQVSYVTVPSREPDDPNELFPPDPERIFVKTFYVRKDLSAELVTGDGKTFRIMLVFTGGVKDPPPGEFDLVLNLPADDIDGMAPAELARLVQDVSHSWIWTKDASDGRRAVPTEKPSETMKSMARAAAAAEAFDTGIGHPSNPQDPPVRSWSEVATFADGSQVAFHRKTWKSGATTEVRELVRAARR